MIDLKTIQNFYFVGIGGIGMSALARYFNLQGKKVYGYDKTPSNITVSLQKQGVQVQFDDVISTLPKAILDRENSLIVYTPAIPITNCILNWFSENEYRILKRAKLLGEISKTSICLAVAGTHGKTTTSAILGHLLAACNMPVTAFLGGVSENYQSNLIYKGSDIMVVEADEFDRSFLQLHPDIACITTMDVDHLDIYKNSSDFKTAFTNFSKLITDQNHLLYQKGLALQGNSVSVMEEADFYVKNVQIKNGAYVFDLITPKNKINNCRFYLPGRHNLFNAVIALGMAILVGAPINRLPKALSEFKGVRRRFSFKINRKDLVVIDDYAHHPTEINALFQAVSEMYPTTEKLIVFQPHLYSRTKDFGIEFAKSLSQFDEIILLEIYPAREEPIDGINSNWLLDQIPNKNKKIVTKVNLPFQVKNSKCSIKLLVGAGDIGVEVEKVTKYLRNEN